MVVSFVLLLFPCKVRTCCDLTCHFPSFVAAVGALALLKCCFINVSSAALHFRDRLNDFGGKYLLNNVGQ